MLPGRAVLLDTLASRLPASGSAETPTVLLLVGLVRSASGWPISDDVLDEVTRRMASCLRGDDWLGISGPGEFAAVMVADVEGAESAATRVLASIAEAGISDLACVAGVAQLSPELSPSALLRRGTLSLTVARSIGGGQVIRYSGKH